MKPNWRGNTGTGEKHFLGGQRRLDPKGRGSSVLQIFGTPYVRQNNVTWSDEIWHRMVTHVVPERVSGQSCHNA